MAASASFCFEDGMRTSSCIATLALRMRVSMSAIGSVIVIVRLPSPAGLGHAGDLARVHELAQADPAQAELAVHRSRPAAAPATGVGPDLVLGLALLLLDQRLLGHLLSPFPGLGRALPAGSRSAALALVEERHVVDHAAREREPVGGEQRSAAVVVLRAGHDRD